MDARCQHERIYLDPSKPAYYMVFGGRRAVNNCPQPEVRWEGGGSVNKDRIAR